ncbi:helix-turn-helix transcriptional regulator [Candidatus Saccharibacteria bacterium]|nr:helix-turn-helix transcriptional regulator [Candidatus Saccharibacteria bacterium]
MKNYQDMLRSILASSGWSQEQLAARLGVSFPTVNYWLNNKVIPRRNMQKRIRNLYLASKSTYDGPTYITFDLPDTVNVKIGDKIK